MIHVRSSPTFVDRDHQTMVVRVDTKHCAYRVEIDDEEILVKGPGLDETLSRSDFPSDATSEALAAMAVIYLENRE